jgi:uncharacterized protein YlxW (UPF0749 family)
VTGRRPGAGEQPPPQTLSMAMLNDLLNNTLDPGYRAAADRRGGRRWWDGPLAWVGCLAIGLVLVVAYQQSHRSAPAREQARQDLISRIRNLQGLGDTREATARQLAADVAALRDRQLSGASTELRNLEIAAGTIAVSGPGLSVALDEPPAPATSADTRPGALPQTQVSVIHDKDIRGVVNQMWSAGAEAVAVNGVRLTSTTAIRFAGESVLVDFQPISPPYTIEAIGDRDRLLLAFADSAIARQLKTKSSVDGITFTFAGKGDLHLQSVTVGQPVYAFSGASPSAAPTRPSPTASSTESPR